MTLKEFYDSIGGDYEDAVTRFRMEPLVQKFVLRFPEDTSFAELKAALEAGETEKAFGAAHTLKGVAANLSLAELTKSASEVTEHLRAGNLEEGKAGFPPVEAAYEAAIAAIEKLG